MRLRALLPVLRDRYHPKNLPVKRARELDNEKLDGKNNAIYFSQLAQTRLVVEDQDGKIIEEYKAPNIVINKVKKDGVIDDRKKSVAELKKHSVSTARIYRYIFNDDKSIVITLRAHSDLFTYLAAGPISLDIAKRIIGQLLTAVDILHRYKLAHRDIKIENILVYIDSNKNINIKLADLDTLENAEELATMPAGTIETLPAKVLMKIKHDGKEYTVVNAEEFFNTNKIELDRYATGCAIADVARRLSKKDPELEKMIKGLKSDDSKKSMSVQQAMDSSFFGLTATDRSAYFKAINSVVSEQYYLDGYYLRQFHTEGDVFYIMPSQVKQLYCQVEQVAEQLQHVKEFKYVESCVKKSAAENAEKLLNECKKIVDEKNVDHDHKIVNQITEMLSRDLKEVDLKVDHREVLQSQVKQLHQVLAGFYDHVRRRDFVESSCALDFWEISVQSRFLSNLDGVVKFAQKIDQQSAHCYKYHEFVSLEGAYNECIDTCKRLINSGIKRVPRLPQLMSEFRNECRAPVFAELCAGILLPVKDIKADAESLGCKK